MTKYQRFVTRLLRAIANAKTCHTLRIVLIDASDEAGACVLRDPATAAKFTELARKCLLMVGEVAGNLYGGRIHVLAQIVGSIDV